MKTETEIMQQLQKYEDIAGSQVDKSNETIISLLIEIRDLLAQKMSV